MKQTPRDVDIKKHRDMTPNVSKTSKADISVSSQLPDDGNSVAGLIEDCFRLKPGHKVKMNQDVFDKLKEELKRRFTPSCEVSNVDSVE